MPSLADAFRAALPEEDRAALGHPELEAELETALATAVARARAAHPEIRVDGGALARYLALHTEEGAPSSWLGSRNLADLQIACGIVHGDPEAIGWFERYVLADVHTAVARLLKDDERAADVVSEVREKLVVGTESRPPRIADYGGHGDLLVWVRVIAIRVALSQLRRDQRSVPADDRLWELASPALDPALAAIKRDSASAIKAAFHVGLSALTPRQRNLLRQHLIDGLTIDDLGAIYQVHRVTAARWLTSARADLWSQTRRELRTTLGLTDSTIGAMLDEIRSTLDLSIERALAEPKSG